MMQLLRVRVLLVTCCLVQQVPVTALAQEERPRVATGNAGQTAVTKPGEADDVKSPAWTGERRPLYRLGHDDVLELTFNFVPEFNQTVTVQPDGYISLKNVAPLYVEGLTIPQISEQVRNSYAEILNAAEVTVILKQFEKPYFVANGEVTHPGKYDLGGDTTVAEAVGIAGGFTRHARHSQVVLFRRNSGGTFQAQLINVKRMLKSRDLAEDIHISPGDMLFVPQNTISKIDKYFPASYLSLYGNANQF